MSKKSLLLWSGFGYLVIFFAAIFSNFAIIENLVVSGNAIETAKNIANNQFLFRAGILSFLVAIIFDIVVAVTLYTLFTPTQKEASLLSTWFRMTHAILFGAAMFPLMQAATQDGELLMRSLEAFNNLWMLGLFFFGLHLLLLSYLLIKAKFAPKVISLFLALAGIAYIADTSALILLENYTNYHDQILIFVATFGIIGEMGFTLLLLYKGFKQKTAS